MEALWNVLRMRPVLKARVTLGSHDRSPFRNLRYSTQLTNSEVTVDRSCSIAQDMRKAQFVVIALRRVHRC